MAFDTHTHAILMKYYSFNSFYISTYIVNTTCLSFERHRWEENNQKN